MKKLLFISVFSLGSLGAFAQVSGQSTDQTQTQTTDPTQSTTDPTQSTTDPTQSTANPTQQSMDTDSQPMGTDSQPMDTDSQPMDTDSQPMDTDSQSMDSNESTATDPTMGTTGTSTQGAAASTSSDGYTAMDMKEMPKSLKKSFKKNYPDGKVDKIYSNTNGQYKLETSKKDGTSETMYMDEQGNPIENY